MNKIADTIRVQTTINIPENNLVQVRKSINLMLTGKENCNKYNKNGKIVPNNSSKIDHKLQKVHFEIMRGAIIWIEFDITEEGNQINHRIVKE